MRTLSTMASNSSHEGIRRFTVLFPKSVQKSFPLSTGTGHSTPLMERIDKVLLQPGKMLHEQVGILGRSWEHKSKRAGRMVETEYQNPEKGPFLLC